MSIDAMKQALEALDCINPPLNVRGMRKLGEAMRTLRQAIEMSEKNVRVSDKWVGLTDEEIYDYADEFLYQGGINYGIKSFGKAIEAKLKEKNT